MEQLGMAFLLFQLQKNVIITVAYNLKCITAQHCPLAILQYLTTSIFVCIDMLVQYINTFMCISTTIIDLLFKQVSLNVFKVLSCIYLLTFITIFTFFCFKNETDRQGKHIKLEHIHNIVISTI